MNKQQKETGKLILRSTRIGQITCQLAKGLGISPIEALKKFYISDTCKEFHTKETGLYLQSNTYIVNDFLKEIRSSSN